MENIIRGLEILSPYNGQLYARQDMIKVEDFEYRKLLADDLERLEKLEWKLLIKRSTGELIRASFYTGAL